MKKHGTTRHPGRNLCYMASTALVLMTPHPPAEAKEYADIGSHRKLFVDEHLIEHMHNCELRMHHPVPREIAMVFDKPWEGNSCGYSTTIFHDGEKYRMYYLARHFDWPAVRGMREGDAGFLDKLQTHPPFIGYAESDDGIRWTRPNLGIVEFEGSRENNIVALARDLHHVFLDTNPKCAPDARYKAIRTVEKFSAEGRKHGHGLIYALKSPDGIHWEPMSEEPIIADGALDSHNVAYYDGFRDEYRIFYRDFRDGIRGIKTAVSKDFITWSNPDWLAYDDDYRTHLYVNSIKSYHRAPQLFVGLPMRYVDSNQGRPRREVALWKNYHDHWPNRSERKMLYDSLRRAGTARTDTILMTSRDGVNFKRRQEAFIRPGPHNWTYADNCAAWHIVETESEFPDMPNELSIYASEGFWMGDDSMLRRYTLRLDGFVSVHAGGEEAEMLTKPLVFAGRTLEINYATSAAGWIRIEIQDAAERPIPGFSLAEAHKIVGDNVDRVVSWNEGTDLSKLSGKVVRLRFVMWDADLYAIRFREDEDAS